MYSELRLKNVQVLRMEKVINSSWLYSRIQDLAEVMKVSRCLQIQVRWRRGSILG